jgi:hypothetical protein
MEKISWTDRVRKYCKDSGRRKISYITVQRKKAYWICHILRSNCLLKYVTKRKVGGRTEVIERRGRRRKQLLDDIKETTRYWKQIRITRSRSVENSLWKRL